jgi:hypothetical protein
VAADVNSDKDTCNNRCQLTSQSVPTDNSTLTLLILRDKWVQSTLRTGNATKITYRGKKYHDIA